MNLKKTGKAIVTALLIGALAVSVTGCGKDKAKGASGDAGNGKKVITVAHTN